MTYLCVELGTLTQHGILVIMPWSVEFLDQIHLTLILKKLRTNAVCRHVFLSVFCFLIVFLYGGCIDSIIHVLNNFPKVRVVVRYQQLWRDDCHWGFAVVIIVFRCLLCTKAGGVMTIPINIKLLLNTFLIDFLHEYACAVLRGLLHSRLASSQLLHNSATDFIIINCILIFIDAQEDAWVQVLTRLLQWQNLSSLIYFRWRSLGNCIWLELLDLRWSGRKFHHASHEILGLHSRRIILSRLQFVALLMQVTFLVGVRLYLGHLRRPLRIF